MIRCGGCQAPKAFPQTRGPAGGVSPLMRGLNATAGCCRCKNAVGSSLPARTTRPWLPSLSKESASHPGPVLA